MSILSFPACKSHEPDKQQNRCPSIHSLLPSLVAFLETRKLEATGLTLGDYRMAKKTTKRRAWTSEQERTLKVLARKKTRAAKIAKTLKRTEGATRQKAFSMGLSLDSRV